MQSLAPRSTGKGIYVVLKMMAYYRLSLETIKLPTDTSICNFGR